MRADQSLADVRFSVTMGRRAREEARAMIEKYRPGLNAFDNRAEAEAMAADIGREYAEQGGIVNDEGWDDFYAKRADEKGIERYVDQIAAFDTPKERKAALYWFCKATVRLPEDAQKVRDALKTAERAHVDPFQFDRPGAILEQYSAFVPKEPPINPDTVPELSDRRDMGHGIVTYLVQDDKQGQAAMRRIINTHFGKDASPWCLLQGDGDGNLTDDAWHYWNHYNALPKRVAFHNGHLSAFMATEEGEPGQIFRQNSRGQYTRETGLRPYDRESGNDTQEFKDWYQQHIKEVVPEQWWDRADEPHSGIPFTRSVPAPTGEGASATEHCELLPDGTTRVTKVTRGKPHHGKYEEWKANGAYIETIHENGIEKLRSIYNEKGIETEHTEIDYIDAHELLMRFRRDQYGELLIAQTRDAKSMMNLEYNQYGYDSDRLVFYDRDGNVHYIPYADEDDLVQMVADLHAAIKANDQPAVDAIVADLKRRATTGQRHSVQRTTRLAPNGKRSNLTDSQYDHVRTPAFKAWFGDWENDPANASKILDENGEPLVVTHASYDDFWTFDEATDKAKNYDIPGFYFLDAKYGAYANRPVVKHFFLNIRNPLVAPIKTVIGKTADGQDRVRVDNTLSQYTANGHYAVTADGSLRDIGRRDLLADGYDGAIRFQEYIATSPTQIKSATDNSGAFSPANPDTRYSVTAINALRDIADGKDKCIIHNREYGDIEYNLGRTGKRGMGLAHIVENRMAKDGDTLDGAIDVAIRVAEAAESGTVTLERYNTKHFDRDGVRAIVAFTTDGNKVITGYEINADVSGGANRRSPSTQSQPHVSLEEIVAALKSKLASLPTSRIIPFSANPVNQGGGTFSNGVRGGAPSIAPNDESPAERASMRNSVFVGSKAVQKIGQMKSLMQAELMLIRDFNRNYSPEARDEIYLKTGWWRDGGRSRFSRDGATAPLCAPFWGCKNA